MFTVITILLIILSIFLIGLVLLQPGKGDLSAQFGGIGGQMGSMFGMQRTANLLSKMTKYLAAVILVLAVIANFFLNDPEVQSVNKPVTEGAKAPATSPLAPAPVEAPKELPAGGGESGE